ncbi:uncharacterized protein HMPREF1541_10062 [Cyphellophora europaea CBS 101466]|uniref:Cytochrome P450 n=1 Tax=Cyphellophora europaea (strain CBS 101466) TaxID=1220924 RepID=W2S961_CYPE1|nr:uncharacterized protein HMPREF1541_10062 [Cyphellophora europaea CBS 101466]ETN45185.1 hypothetical protein HMPREF1541_10062 [Cyphellophora europaea CBS 101466]
MTFPSTTTTPWLPLPLPLHLLLPAALGILAHRAYFIRGEHVLSIPPLLLTTTLLCTTTIALRTLIFQLPLLPTAFLITSIAAAFVTGCLASTVIYRVSPSHRLHGVPGPFAARLSIWYFMWKNVGLQGPSWFEEIHARYGEVVRIGSDTISVSDPDIIAAVHSPMSRCGKPIGYLPGWPLTTLQQLRDKTMHNRRRRLGWDQAFTAKSLRGYESRILKYVSQLEASIRGAGARPIDITERIRWFSFDVMGDLAFGRSFNGLQSETTHWAIDAIYDSNKTTVVVGCTPWLAHLLTRLPDWLNPQAALLRFSDASLQARQQLDPEEPDIMSHLLAADAFYADPKAQQDLMKGDSRLIIIAGSDTTASTLTFLFYYLASEPQLQRRLRKELAANNLHDSASIAVESVQHLPYLDGLVNETLRLHPPVQTSTMRETPAEGLQVGDRFIPGLVTITTPLSTIHRSPKAFRQPNDFIPERWTTRPELILNKSAFAPFLAGPYGCIGKQLAMMELRTVAARLVLAFQISLAEGEDGSRLLRESEDVFTTHAMPLRLVFEERKGGTELHR